MRIQATALASLLLVVVCRSFAQDSPADWLAKMSLSQRQLNYEGVLTYLYHDQMRSFRIAHLVMDGHEINRIETLDGPEQELVRQGHGPDCEHAGPKLITLSGRAGREGFERYYDVNLAGPDRVADRDVVQLEIRPRDVYRLGIDRDTGLLLRSEVLDQQGRTLERLQYVSLNYAPEVDGVAALSEPSLSTSPTDALAGTDSRPQNNWQTSWLPAGFTAAKYDDLHAQGRSYTDGLAVFSIFVESMISSNGADMVAVEGSRRRGASISYTAVFPDRHALVTVIGEVPLLTARQVARSIVWTGQ
ncbi:MucB/RseB C-terminal domain-containing protein [Spongiibacter taiwanensis]